jgi:hypothetical protein
MTSIIKKIIILLVIIITLGFLGLGYLWWNKAVYAPIVNDFNKIKENKELKNNGSTTTKSLVENKDLQIKMRELLNPSDCKGNIEPFGGYISEIKNMSITLKKAENDEGKKIELNTGTLFVKLSLNEKRDIVSEQIISEKDLAKLNDVVVVACTDKSGTNMAKIVKLLITPK